MVMDLLEFVDHFFNAFGATIVVPIMIFIIALLLRLPLKGPPFRYLRWGRFNRIFLDYWNVHARCYENDSSNG